MRQQIEDFPVAVGGHRALAGRLSPQRRRVEQWRERVRMGRGSNCRSDNLSPPTEWVRSNLSGKTSVRIEPGRLTDTKNFAPTMALPREGANGHGVTGSRGCDKTRHYSYSELHTYFRLALPRCHVISAPSSAHGSLPRGTQYGYYKICIHYQS